MINPKRMIKNSGDKNKVEIEKKKPKTKTVQHQSLICCDLFRIVNKDDAGE